jgi:hypothetical protein
VIAEDEDGAEPALLSVGGKQAGTGAAQAGFLEEFSEDGVLGCFTDLDKAAGECPLTEAGLDGTLDQEDLVATGDDAAGGGDGIGIVEAQTASAIGTVAVAVVAGNEGAAADGAVVPGEGGGNAHEREYINWIVWGDGEVEEERESLGR